MLKSARKRTLFFFFCFCFPLAVLSLSTYVYTPSGRERRFCTRLRPVLSRQVGEDRTLTGGEGTRAFFRRKRGKELCIRRGRTISCDLSGSFIGTARSTLRRALVLRSFPYNRFALKLAAACRYRQAAGSFPNARRTVKVPFLKPWLGESRAESQLQSSLKFFAPLSFKKAGKSSSYPRLLTTPTAGRVSRGRR